MFLTDVSGTVVWKGDYLPFGGVFSEDRDPDGDGVEVDQPFRFPGQYHDPEIGLYYNYFRDYDPALGRYVEADPIGLAGGDLNLYGYTLGDPVNGVDPGGLYWEYSQSTGQLTHVDNQSGDRMSLGTGYSGSGKGLNNPNMQNVPFVGPIPQGDYDVGVARASKGALTLPLSPQQGTNTFGRDAFLIHGDNSRFDQSASEGCIITSRNVRNQINNSQDRELRVTP